MSFVNPDLPVLNSVNSALQTSLIGDSFWGQVASAVLASFLIVFMFASFFKMMSKVLWFISFLVVITSVTAAIFASIFVLLKAVVIPAAPAELIVGISLFVPPNALACFSIMLSVKTITSVYQVTIVYIHKLLTAATTS